MVQNETNGLVPRWRRAIFRYFSGFDIAELRKEQLQLHAATREAAGASLQPILAWVRQAEGHLAAIQMDRDRLHARIEQVGEAHVSTLEWIRHAEGHLAAIQTDRDQLNGRIEQAGEAQASTLDWIRHAEGHLAAIQTDRDRLAARIEQIGEAHASTLEWIRAAEVHLAALQGDHEHFDALSWRQSDYLTRLVARIALLESRLGDLERADTAIAAALASSSASDLLK